MSYEQVWAVIVILTLCAWGALWVWARHLRERKRVAVREMVHRERLAALEKGQPLPEVPGEAAAGEAGSDGAAWVSRASLLAGLGLVFSGLGFAVAFALIPATPEMGGMRELAPMGLLPVFTGLGLLLFYVLDRRSRRPPGA